VKRIDNGSFICDLKVCTSLVFVEFYQASERDDNQRLQEVAPEHHKNSHKSAKYARWEIVSVTDYKKL
jgi:hypothetical protein